EGHSSPPAQRQWAGRVLAVSVQVVVAHVNLTQRGSPGWSIRPPRDQNLSSRDTGVPVRGGRAGHPEQRAGSAGLHPGRESVQNEFETAEEVLVGFLVCGFFVREHLGSEHRRGLRKPFRVDKML